MKESKETQLRSTFAPPAINGSSQKANKIDELEDAHRCDPLRFDLWASKNFVNRQCLAQGNRTVQSVYIRESNTYSDGFSRLRPIFTVIRLSAKAS